MKKRTAPRASVILEAGCTLRDAMDMQFLLLAADCSGRKVVVDGAHVERLDTAGIQLLVAFAQDQAKAGKALQWSGASDLLVRSCQRLGVDGMLGLPVAPTQQAARS